jgi:Cu/Ag efflux pump CusA
LQDWFLKFELKTIPNVAEVASVGGVVKQYQIQVNPLKLAQYGISLPEVKQALESSNQEAGDHLLKSRRRSIWSAPAVISRPLMISITLS